MNYNNLPSHLGHPSQYSQISSQNFHNEFETIKTDCPLESRPPPGYYGHSSEMEIDQQPRRAISYGGPPPSFIQQ